MSDLGWAWVPPGNHAVTSECRAGGCVRRKAHAVRAPERVISRPAARSSLPTSAFASLKARASIGPDGGTPTCHSLVRPGVILHRRCPVLRTHCSSCSMVPLPCHSVSMPGSQCIHGAHQRHPACRSLILPDRPAHVAHAYAEPDRRLNAASAEPSDTLCQLSALREAEQGAGSIPDWLYVTRARVGALPGWLYSCQATPPRLPWGRKADSPGILWSWRLH